MKTALDEHRRRAYLDALGIRVWWPRDAEDPLTASAPASEAEPAELPPPETAPPVADAPAPRRRTAPGPAAPVVVRSPSAANDPEVALLDWDSLQSKVSACTRCVLHESRTQTVFGVGNRQARLMVIGEAPGVEEDRRGEPFVGRAGQLLDEMLQAIGHSRESVFIANVLKCRPPGNRDPHVDEAAACRAYLERQIALVDPAMILAVGRVAAQNLLGSDEAVGRLRRQVHDFHGRPLVVTYHPAYLLREPQQKRKSWEDLRRVRDVLAERAA